MVGFLGMMAAGAAVGARNASKMDVQAQNQMEMERIRSNIDIDREALRQKYLDKKFVQQSEMNAQQFKAKALLDESRYQRERQDKLSDSEANRKHQLELEGIKESGRNSRFNQRQSLLKEKGSSVSSGASGSVKASSDIGRKVEDIVRLKLAPDEKSAYEMLMKLDIVKAAQQNPMNKFSDDELLNSVDRLTRGLYPSGVAKQDSKSEQGLTEYVRDPKTGKLTLK